MIGKRVVGLVASHRGGADIRCAADAARVCSLDGGVANSRSVVVDLLRRKVKPASKKDTGAEAISTEVDDDEPSTAEKWPKIAGVNSFHTRRFQYNSDGDLKQLELHRIPHWNEAAPDLVLSGDELAGICAQNPMFSAPPAQLSSSTQIARPVTAGKDINTLDDRRRAEQAKQTQNRARIAKVDL